MSLERLFAEADDYELATIEAVAKRAGLMWDCLDDDDRAHWTNDETDEVCRECGKARKAKGEKA